MKKPSRKLRALKLYTGAARGWRAIGAEKRESQRLWRANNSLGH